MPRRSGDHRAAHPGSRRLEVGTSGPVVTVSADGHPQSCVNLEDPTDLAFEYMQHMALVLAALGTDGPRVTHVGGAGLTMARWVQHRAPGTPQIVLEPDEELTALVRQHAPLPRGHRIRVRGVDGRTGLSRLAAASADVVILDAYADGRVPADLVSAEALADMARVLRPDGLFLANLADEPTRSWLARVAASVAAAGLHGAAAIGLHEVLKGRRFGNVVVMARRPGSEDPQALVDAVRRAAASAPLPTGVRRLADLVRPARPFTDADSLPSPPAPTAGAWRRA